MSEENKSNFVTGLVLGSVIGAGLIFLFGTAKGKKLQKEIKKKGEEAIENLPKSLEGIQKKGEEVVEKATDIKEEIIKKGGKISDNISDQTSETIESVKDAAGTLIDEVREKGSDLTEKLQQNNKRKFFHHSSHNQS